jgi:hypothetical protein
MSIVTHIDWRGYPVIPRSLDARVGLDIIGTLESDLVSRVPPPGDDRSKSKYSGSWSDDGRLSSLRIFGLAVGDTRGDVCNEAGISSVVSKTKNASPPSPSFIE